MDLIYQIIFTFFIGVISSFIGAITGAGGLIYIPALIFIGLSPQSAMATGKFAAFGLSLGAIIPYWRKKKIIWKIAIPFAGLAIIGGLIGANILLKVNEKILTIIVGTLLLGLLPIILIKRDLGIKSKATSRNYKIIGVICYFLVMIYGGFFGGGTGTFIFYTLMFFFGFTMIEAGAIRIFSWLILSFCTLVFFATKGVLDYTAGISLLAGTIIGGYLGAHTAIKKGNKWVKALFAIMVVVSAIKILFF